MLTTSDDVDSATLGRDWHVAFVSNLSLNGMPRATARFEVRAPLACIRTLGLAGPDDRPRTQVRNVGRKLLVSYTFDSGYAAPTDY